MLGVEARLGQKFSGGGETGERETVLEPDYSEGMPLREEPQEGIYRAETCKGQGEAHEQRGL